jgi:hypothetical protein
VSSTDAVFNPEAGYEPLRLSRTLPFLLRRAGAPFPRPRAKNGGPLQAVPVMARAMAERLEQIVPCQSKPFISGLLKPLARLRVVLRHVAVTVVIITEAMRCPTISFSLDSRAPLLRGWPCRCFATTSH